MHPLAIKTALSSVLALFLVGCSVPKEAGFPDVAKTIQQRTGQSVRWRQDSIEAAAIDRMVTKLLGQPLTVQGAVQLALLNNRMLQAKYEELGIAQAEVVQAGMLDNPSLDAAVTFPVDGEPANLSFGASQNFLSILFMSAKKRLAEAEFERTKLEVGDTALSLAAETRSAYYAMQAAGQIVTMQRIVTEAAEVSWALAQRQHDAQNIGDLEFALQRLDYEEARMTLAKSEGDLVAERERLTQLLGLWGQQVNFQIVPKLADMAEQEPSLDHLERQAIAQRLDIAAARRNTEVAQRALALARDGRWLGALELGAELEREPHEAWRVGPKASLTLPLFDQGQAVMFRLEAVSRQAEHELAALSIEARSQVRAARDRLLLSRRMVEHYKAVIIPLREQVLALSQQHYDAMLIGVYQLLSAKQQEAKAYSEYIEAVRDYWIARSDLERAIGK